MDSCSHVSNQRTRKDKAMKMTEHEAIEEIKDRLGIFEPEDNEELEQKFYNSLTLDEILDELRDYNCLIGEIKQIFREIETSTDEQNKEKHSGWHGGWVGVSCKGSCPKIDLWRCSVCGAEFECEDIDFDYCPSCGAKMDLRK